MTQQCYAIYVKNAYIQLTQALGKPNMKILRKVPCHSTVRITEFPFSSVNNKDLHSLALSSGSTNINNHASPTLKKNQQKNKRIPEKVSRNESNI